MCLCSLYSLPWTHISVNIQYRGSSAFKTWPRCKYEKYGEKLIIWTWYLRFFSSWVVVVVRTPTGLTFSIFNCISNAAKVQEPLQCWLQRNNELWFPQGPKVFWGTYFRWLEKKAAFKAIIFFHLSYWKVIIQFFQRQTDSSLQCFGKPSIHWGLSLIGGQFPGAKFTSF